ncbi:hypothetical protein LCGC14_2577770, partial [marine sediment metagenome]
MVSDLLSRFSLSRMLGKAFGGKRDYYEVYGYPKDLTFEDFLAKYRRQDIAKRIVNAPPAGTWRSHPIFKDAGNKFDTKWGELVRNHSLWYQFERMDRLAGIGRFGVALLGFDDSTDFTQEAKTAKQLLYIQPFTESGVKIKALEQNVSSSRFGLPTMYEIDVIDPANILLASRFATSGVKSKTLNVHWSRTIHIAENPLEDQIVGTSRLEEVFNLLEDLMKIAGGSAETYWLAGNRGMQVDVDKDMDLDSDDTKALSDELEEYMHELRRFIRTRGVKIHPLGGDVADPRSAFDVVIALISGATGIPRRILIGSEAGHLASEQDRANWADRLEERQQDFAEPQILFPFIDRCVSANVLPKPNEKMTVEWPSTFTLTPLENAQRMAQKARAAINFSRQDQFSAPVMTLPEIREALDLPPEPDGDLHMKDQGRINEAKKGEAEARGDTGPNKAYL